MTVAELFDIVRRDLNDTTTSPTTQRWPDTVLLRYYNACRQILWTRKQFTFFKTSILVAYPGDISSTATTIDFEEIWSSAVVDYVDGRCLAEDSEDANMQALSADHMSKFLGAVS